MIKVIVERQLKSWEDIGRLLFDLHMKAVQQKGHISNEVWIEPNSKKAVSVLTTWQSIDDWNTWISSPKRAEIIEKIEPLLAEKEQIKIYEIMSVNDLDYFADPESWILEHEHPHFAG